MNWIIFCSVVITSSLIAIIWQLLFNIYPAWRRLKIAQSLATLAKCLAHLNQDAFLNAKIDNRQDLHDKYYKFLFSILTHKIDLRFSMLRNIKHDEKSEEEFKKFHSEIEKLDIETKTVITNASFAVGKILILRNPIIFILACCKIRKKRHQSVISKETRRREVTNTAEYITINAQEDDYNLIPAAA